MKVYILIEQDLLDGSETICEVYRDRDLANSVCDRMNNETTNNIGYYVIPREFVD